MSVIEEGRLRLYSEEDVCKLITYGRMMDDRDPQGLIDDMRAEGAIEAYDVTDTIDKVISSPKLQRRLVEFLDAVQAVEEATSDE